MSEELNRFKLYLLQGKGSFDGKIINRSPRTVALHIELMGRLLVFCPHLSVVEIEQHLLSLKEKGRKGTYINDYIDTLRLFGRFKNTKKYEKLSYYPEEEFEAAIMSDDEIEAFLKLPPPTVRRLDKRTGRTLIYQWSDGWETWNMFWKLVSYHPVRLGEIAHLTVDDVDFGLGELHVRGKTGKRDVSIHPAVLEDIKQYISSLETPQLFPSTRGGKHRQNGVFDDVDWGYSFHNRIKRLGIKRTNLRPYSLRHSSISRLADGGVNPFLLMDMAGHKNLNTTLHYYHKSRKAKQEAMRKDSLGRKLLTLYERQKIFRELVWKLLENYANNAEEEKLLIEGLKRF